MGQVGKHVGLIVLIAGGVLFVNLGGARLWDRDEPRNAGCAREMLERGDWVVPIFNAELRPHKPVLLYWLIMSAYGMFGVNEFAARFWSATLGIGTALATYQIGRRLFSPQVGLWAALILATSVMFDVAGRAATPDSVLIFCVTVGLMIYVCAVFPARDQGAGSPLPIPPAARAQGTGLLEPGASGRTWFPTSWLPAALCYGMWGLAVLAKGPIGVLLPAATIGLFMAIMGRSGQRAGSEPPPRLPRGTREESPAPNQPLSTGQERWFVAVLRTLSPVHLARTCWQMRPLTAVLVVAAIAVPWYLVVGWRTEGEFLLSFLYEHNIGRALRPMEGHEGPIVYYPLVMLAGFFPWSVFALPLGIEAVAGLRRRDDHRPGYILACCWIGVYVGLFSIAQTKLPSYVTPCYPALALLTACYLDRWKAGQTSWPRLGPRLAMSALALVGVAWAIALPLAARRFLPGEAWLGWLAAFPLLAAVTVWRLMEAGRRVAAVRVFAGWAVLFAGILFGLIPLRVDRHQQIHVLLEAIAQRSDEPQVAAYGRLEPSWVFYCGRPIHELRAGPGEAGDVDPARSAAEFFGAAGDRFIITPDRCWDELRPQLPPEATVLATCPLFLRDELLLLIGRESLKPGSAARTRTPGAG